MARKKRYTKQVEELMEKKTYVLTKAQAFSAVGMDEFAEPLWASAAAQEERIAPLLETLGRDVEAAMHRVSAASCYEKVGDFARAANLYRAALSGVLLEKTRVDVEKMLASCLSRLAQSPAATTSTTSN